MNFGLSNVVNSSLVKQNQINPDVCAKCGKRLYCYKWTQYLENFMYSQIQYQQPQCDLMQQQIQPVMQHIDTKQTVQNINNEQQQDLTSVLDVVEILQKQVISLTNEMNDIKILTQQGFQKQVAEPKIVQMPHNILRPSSDVANNINTVVQNTNTSDTMRNSVLSNANTVPNNFVQQEAFVQSQPDIHVVTSNRVTQVPRFENEVITNDNSNINSSSLVVYNPNEKPEYIVEDGTTKKLVTNIFGKEVYKKVKDK